MKKLLRRTLAFVVAAATIFTSVNLSEVAKAFPLGPVPITPETGVEAKTFGDILADNYVTLSAGELAFLRSGALNAEALYYVEPTAELINVNPTAKTIALSNYTDSKGNDWTVPATAELSASSYTETVTVPGNFTYSGSAYSVGATYSLYTEAYTKAQQVKALNALWTIMRAEDVLKALEKEVIDGNYDVILSYKTQIAVTGYDVEPLQDLKDEIAAYQAGRSQYVLENADDILDLIKGDSGLLAMFKELASPNKQKAIRQGIQLKTGSAETANSIVAAITRIYEEFYKVLYKGDASAYECIDNGIWSALDRSLFVSDVDFAELDTNMATYTASNPTSDRVVSEADVYDELWVADTELSADTNRSTMYVKFAANVYNDAGVLTTINSAAFQTKIDTAADAATIETTINGLVAANKAAVLASTEWTLYGVGDTGYEATSPALPTSVTDGYTYTITYNPKSFSVTDWNSAATNMYYGQKLALPTYESEHSGDDSRAYTYKVNGVSTKQGISVKITADTTITRLDFPKADEIDLGQIIADSYAGSDTNLAVALKSNAFVTGSISVSKPTDNSIISIVGGTVTADNYAASATLIWKPVSLKVISGTDVIGTETFTGNTADVSSYGTNYDSIEVTYRVVYTDDTITASTVEGILADMTAIKSDSATQLTAAKAIKNLYSKLYSLHNNSYGLSVRAIVSAISNYGGISADTQDAAQDILSNRLSGNNLDLYQYVIAMQSLTSDAELLAYYYKNYAHFTQVANLAEDLVKVSADPQVISTAASLGGSAQSSVDSLTAVSNELNAIYANLKPIHSAINTTVADSILNAFAAGVLGASAVPAYSASTEIAQRTTLTKSAPNKTTFTIEIKTYDYAGTLVEANSGSAAKSFSFDTATGTTYTTAVHSALGTITDQLAIDLGVDITHYNLTPPTTSFVTGEVVTADQTLTYVFTPKTYTLNVTENGITVDTLTFQYGNNTVTLPTSSSAAVRYEYMISGANRTGSYTFNDTEIANFVSGTLDVVRTSVDVTEEDIIKFVDELNGTVYNRPNTARKKISYIPLDGNGTTTDETAYDGKTDALLMRLTLKGDLSTWMGDVATTFAKMLLNNEYTEIKVNGETFIDSTSGKVSIQVFLKMLLNSGLTLEDFLAKVDDNNLVYEDEELLKYQMLTPYQYPIYTELSPEGEVGAQLLKTTLTLVGASGTRDVDFYMSLEDFNDTGSKMVDVVKLIKKINPYIGIELSNNEINVSLRNERLYQFAAASMILTGKATYKEFADGTVSSTRVGRYFADLVMSLFNEQVNGQYTMTLARFKETLNIFGIDLGTSLDTAFTYLTKAAHTVKLRSTDSAGSGIDTWRVEAYFDFAPLIRTALSKADLGENFSDVDTVLGFFKEYNENKIDLTLNLGLSLNPGSDWTYSALCIDPSALSNAGMRNKLQVFTCYLGDIFTSNRGANSVMVLCDDVEKITLGTGIVLDLNGHKVEKLVVSSGMATIIDSSWTNSGVVNEYVGSLNPLAGKIVGFPESSLTEGYYVDYDGKIYNRYFAFEKDSSGNVVVTLKADAILMAADYRGAVSAMIKDLALELLLNAYGIAGLTLSDASADYTFYDIDVNDIVGLYKSGDYLPAVIDVLGFDDLVAFVNYALSVLFDFSGMDHEFQTTGKVERVFTSHEQHWDVRLTAANEDGTAALDYVTADIVSTILNRVDRQLTLRIENGDLISSLIHDLALVTTESHLQITSATLSEINHGKDVKIDAAIEGVLRMDFSGNNDYVIVLAQIIAEANDRPDMTAALATAIGDGNYAALHDALNATTLNEVLKGIVYVQQTGFQPTGVATADEKETIYNGLFSLLGYVIRNTMGTNVDDSTFASIETAFGQYVTQKIDNFKPSASVTVQGVNHELKTDIDADVTFDAKFFNYDVQAVSNVDGTIYYTGNDVDDALEAALGDSTVTVYNHDDQNKIFFNEDAKITGQVKLVNSYAIGFENSEGTGKYKVYLNDVAATLTAVTDVDVNRMVVEVGPDVPAGYSVKETVTGETHFWELIQTPVDYVCENSRTGIQYATIKEGLEAAQSGDTVFMIADDYTADAENYLLVRPGITFDLAGFKAKVLAMTIVGRFKDTTNTASNAPAGLLIVDKMMFTYSADTTDVAYGLLTFVPVYSAADGGYRAFAVTGYTHTLTKQSGKNFISRFRMKLRSNNYYSAVLDPEGGVRVFVKFDYKRNTSLGLMDEPIIGEVNNAYKTKFLSVLAETGSAYFEATLTTVEEQATMVARPYITSRGMIITAADKTV